MPQVIVIACSDIHLSHKPPIARSAEDDWYAAMKRPLDELRQVAEDHNVPIICAGDIFDDGWRATRCPPELINFAIMNVPPMFAIPGQHDLPNHRYDEIKRSAYWTLCLTGRLAKIAGSRPVGLGYRRIDDGEFDRQKRYIYAFPWGYDPAPKGAEPDRNSLHIAVIHKYIYKNRDTCYPGAPEENKVSNLKEQLQGYDVAIFGDNHIPFDAKVGDTTVFNCGGFMRRKSDERNHRPRIGLVYEDGTVESHYLDVSQDKFLDETESTKREYAEIEAEDFLQQLRKLGSDSLDFREAVNRRLDIEDVDDEVRQIVLESLDV